MRPGPQHLRRQTAFIPPMFLAAFAACFVFSGPARAEKPGAPAGGDGWTELIGPGGLDAWTSVDKRLVTAGDAELAPDNPKNLVALPGSGVLMAEKKVTGLPDLVTRQPFGDCELHLEFMMSKGSNSGVKLHKHYEIQLYDSFGKEELHGSDCGGVYPRWDWVNRRFTYLDDGVPPRTNATRPPGQWQTLDVVFLAPRFDAEGKKVEDARLKLVKLNDQLIQQDVDLKTPTGYIKAGEKEVSEAPLLLQVNHGPVAFRNMRIRPYHGS